MTSIRSRHGLAAEGAPHDDDGNRTTTRTGVAGEGRARCACGALSPSLPSAHKRRIWHRAHKADAIAAPPDDAALDPAVTRVVGDGPDAAVYQLHPLPPELVEGLTTWGPGFGAQIRVEQRLITDHDGNPVIDADDNYVLAPPLGCLYIAHHDDAERSTEDGRPWRLDLTGARTLRDLLNIATARGLL